MRTDATGMTQPRSVEAAVLSRITEETWLHLACEPVPADGWMRPRPDDMGFTHSHVRFAGSLSREMPLTPDVGRKGQ